MPSTCRIFGAMRIGMLLFWGLIIVLIVTLARGFDGKSAGNEFRPRERTALDILGERYARGEIDRSEFEQRCGDLKGSGITTRDW